MNDRDSTDKFMITIYNKTTHKVSVEFCDDYLVAIARIRDLMNAAREVNLAKDNVARLWFREKAGSLLSGIYTDITEIIPEL